MTVDDCSVINDLLALYAEDICSDASKRLVEEHMAHCCECRKRLESLKYPVADTKSNISGAGNFFALGKKIKRHTALIAAVSAFSAVCVSLVLWGLFLSPGDEMGYSLIAFYFILPVLAFVCSWVPAKGGSRLVWCMPVLFGTAGLLLPFAVFGTAEAFMFFVGAVPSVLGCAAGLAILKIRKNKMAQK